MLACLLSFLTYSSTPTMDAVLSSETSLNYQTTHRDTEQADHSEDARFQSMLVQHLSWICISWFSSVHPGECRDNTSMRLRPLSFQMRNEWSSIWQTFQLPQGFLERSESYAINHVTITAIARHMKQQLLMPNLRFSHSFSLHIP
jgi:hypothetical protein